MKAQHVPRSRLSSSRRSETDSPSIRRQRSTLFFNWRIRPVIGPSFKEGIMRNISFKLSFIMLAISLLSAGLAVAAQSPQQRQQAAAQAAPAAPASSESTSINQVVDKITGREAV